MGVAPLGQADADDIVYASGLLTGEDVYVVLGCQFGELHSVETGLPENPAELPIILKRQRETFRSSGRWTGLMSRPASRTGARQTARRQGPGPELVLPLPTVPPARLPATGTPPNTHHVKALNPSSGISMGDGGLVMSVGFPVEATAQRSRLAG